MITIKTSFHILELKISTWPKSLSLRLTIKFLLKDVQRFRHVYIAVDPSLIMLSALRHALEPVRRILTSFESAFLIFYFL